MERRRILFLFVLTKHSVFNYLLQEILLTAWEMYGRKEIIDDHRWNRVE